MMDTSKDRCEDVVRRLDERRRTTFGHPGCLKEAADLLTAQAAENRTLRNAAVTADERADTLFARIAELTAEVDALKGRHATFDRLQSTEARIAELTAELAEANDREIERLASSLIDDTDDVLAQRATAAEAEAQKLRAALCESRRDIMAQANEISVLRFEAQTLRAERDEAVEVLRTLIDGTYLERLGATERARILVDKHGGGA